MTAETSVKLQEIQERWRTVAPGPWERENGIIWNAGGEKVAYSGALTHDVGTLEAIAHAPGDIAWLIARVEALEAELARVAPMLALHGFAGYGFEADEAAG